MIFKMNKFRQRARIWLSRRDQLAGPNQHISDQLEQRALNDQLMLLERVFLLPQGLPGRPDVRHALFSPAKFDLYGRQPTAVFPKFEFSSLVGARI